MSITIDLYRNAALGNRLDGAHPLGDGSAGGTGATLSLVLSGAGRVGFYADYSELSTTGTHTFYVARTHGTTGAVTVDYATTGDTHTTVSGTLSWADGEADIKSFTANVPSKSTGDHRIVATLSNPTGGLVLHNGVNTVAYGVIDDDTIATSNAIFIDADAVSNGTGTEGNPYNNWYSARNAVISTSKYIYIKGMIVPDGTDSVAMSQTVKHLSIANTFEGRTSEADRIVIRGWPGFTGGIDGNAQTDVTGFAADAAAGTATGDLGYITLRKLSFTDLDTSSSGSLKCYALRTRGGATHTLKEWTTEHITVNGVISGAGAAVGAWYTEGGNKSGATEDSGQKMWRWSLSNVTDTSGDPISCYESYRMQNVSIQRCTAETTAGDFYEKEGRNFTNVTGLSLRFNHFKGSRVRMESQAGIPASSYHIIQGNVFDTPRTDFDAHPIWMRTTSAATSVADKHWIVGNVFDAYDFSTFGNITQYTDDFDNLIIFNNIHNECKRPLRISDGATSDPEYLDYNVYYRTTGDETFDMVSGSYASVNALVAATAYEDNNQQGNPNLNANFTLGAGSSGLANGVSGTDCGYQIVGNEVVGA